MFSGQRFAILAFFVAVENIQKSPFFVGKIDWSMNSGRLWVGDINKTYFHFQNLTKNGNKVGAIYKVGFSAFQLFRLSKLCYHFLSSFEIEFFFFYISSYTPHIAARNALTNKFYQKN